MSFLKSLFGGKSAAIATATARQEHKGFVIEAVPYHEGGQWQLAGTISRVIGGEAKSYRFVRADKFSDKGEAAARALDKGRQLIDEQGDKLFS